MKTLYILILFFSTRVFGQQLCIIVPNLPDWGHAVGILYADSLAHDSVGTAFVVGKNNQILTCAHVVGKAKLMFFGPIKSDTLYYVYTINIDYEKDLALLRANHEICKDPLKIGRFSAIFPGDSIYYMGYNTIFKGCCVHQAEVLFVGKTRNYASNKQMDDCVQFNGEGIPGYSGGPVINNNGEVIGILKESWQIRPFKEKTGNEKIRNVAYSIMPFQSELLGR